MSTELYTLAGGLVVPLVTAWLKGAKWFVLVDEGQQARVKTLATVLSAVAAALAAWGGGSFDESSVQGVFDAVVGGTQTLGLATLVHHWFLKKPEVK